MRDFLVFPLTFIFLFLSAILLGQFPLPMDWTDGTIYREHPIILNAEVCFLFCLWKQNIVFCCGFSCQAALAQGKVYKKYVFAFKATGH